MGDGPWGFFWCTSGAASRLGLDAGLKSASQIGNSSMPPGHWPAWWRFPSVGNFTRWVAGGD